jgi:acetyl/propionyl-CoA carboxylase alpha subunit
MKHSLLIDDAPCEAWLVKRGGGYVLFDESGGHDLAPVPGAVVVVDGDVAYVHLNGRAYTIAYQSPLDLYGRGAGDLGEYVSRAPMPGSAVDIAAKPGDEVRAGDTLMIIESMKLETAIKAGCDGVVEAVHVGLGETFERDAILVTLAARES